jgi:2-oxoglutarate dehydrogenase E1 component
MDYADFINRSNADFIERLYQQYQTDPRSLEQHWHAFFAGFEAGGGRAISPAVHAAVASEGGEPAGALGVESADLVHSYRELGHLVANLDPLGHNRTTHPLLELAEFGLSLDDLDRPCGTGSFLGTPPSGLTVRELLNRLRKTYCGTLGVQYMDIADKAQREWLQQRMEPILNNPVFSPEECKALLYQLVAAQGFEEFLHQKYVGAKRFSLEGSESLVPLLNTLVEEGSGIGVEEFVLGMAHRGRLNTLAHVLNKPYETILSEFEGTMLPADNEGDGDVKYHMGYSQDRIVNGRKVHVALSFNPSHLELVNPVVEGIVRAKQYYLGDMQRSKVVPVLIHGDAAFTGQGIVLETLALSEMPYWRTGGTIHVIIDNQIGFTTMPKQGRFTPYPTDVAKTIQAPVFHVNADDPEACVWAAKMAMAFRQQFHCDVMIHLVCYRRHGHNETDEPSFTQPLMYKEIAAHPRVREIYSQRVIADGKLRQEEFEGMKTMLRERLDKAQGSAKERRPREAFRAFGGVWKGYGRGTGDTSARTAVPADTLKKIGEGLSTLPASFTPFPKLGRILSERADSYRGKRPLDWAAAEALALGSLLIEGTPIRFVGQDVQRGTFSHRHACLHDYNNGNKYYPLANLTQTTGMKAADFIIVNTMLSELAVLGFEYGFSSADPRNLVIWEAQFGDFVNGAQPIIDQFIAGAESKWQKFCGLVMLLPHGYEGQGPEHSNGYVERFLSLCAENNMQVVVTSTPGQYFHALRRQMKRNFRKPLISFMPKSLLRAEASTSSLAELSEGSFQLAIDDPTNPPRERVRRVLFCSGKVFFALDAGRRKHQIGDTAIVRVEQLYPFPRAEIQGILAKYRHAQEVCWVQEEPRNRGAWVFMEDRLQNMISETAVLRYFGREEAASPATGSYKLHEIEAEELLAAALDLPAMKTAGAEQNGNGNGAPAATEPSRGASAEVAKK